MNRFWHGVGIALLSVLGALAVAFLLLPVFGRTAVRGVQTMNLSNAVQYRTLLKLYADDHDGRFPVSLSELIPEYLSAADAETIQFQVREKSEHPIYAKQDWLYFGAFFDEKNAPPILIASPQTTGFKGKPPKRIVIAANLTGSIINEDQYQIELKKTIEAMHQRASALAVPSPDTKPDVQ